MTNQPLLQNLQLGAHTLKNRVAMAPMSRLRASADRLPTDLIKDYYAQRASAGLLLSEGIAVSPGATGYICAPGIYSPQQVEAWKEVTEAVHERGGCIFAQLMHTGAISSPDFQGGVAPLAPSAVDPKVKVFTDKGFQPTVTPRAMERQDIKAAVEAFRIAAINAMEAGFDGVQIHAANGYLFDQFLRDGSNLRTDEYGGSVENRARFHFEVLDAVTDVVPSNKVGIRFSPSGIVQVASESNARETYSYVIERLNDYDLAFLEVMETVLFLDEWEAKQKIDSTVVKEVTKHFRNLYQGTLITNGGFTQETGNKIIEDKHADMVSFGSLYISNPDLVERFTQCAPLNENDKSTYYMGGAKGYIDYPTLEQCPEGFKVDTLNS